MGKRYFILLIAAIAAIACDKIGPEPTPDKPVNPGEVTVKIAATKPDMTSADNQSLVRTYWDNGSVLTVHSDDGKSYSSVCSSKSPSRKASFSLALKAESDAVTLRGVIPSGTELASYQKPASYSCDARYDFLLMKPYALTFSGLNEYEITDAEFSHIFPAVGFKFGSSFSAYAGDVIRYVEIKASSSSAYPLAGEFSLSGVESFNSLADVKLTRPEARNSNRLITLDCREAGYKLGTAEIWAVMFDGEHDIESITIYTDRRDITMAPRKLALKAGSACEHTLELTASDKVYDYDPGMPETSSKVFRFKDCVIAAPAHRENFLCMANGHSYSPYTLRYLDPFILDSSNPNGWTTSSANKLADAPQLTEEEYASVPPYVMFHPSANALYGPASKYTIMMTYSYDAMLHVNQYGTPAVMFRRLESSGAASEESTVAQWVRSGKIESISTSSDGNVMVKNTSSTTISRNFKVDKSAVSYQADGTGRDTWKLGDVVMVQWLDRNGNATSKAALKSGFIHLRVIDSEGYDSVSKEFMTMDTKAKLTVDIYWEK